MGDGAGYGGARRRSRESQPLRVIRCPQPRRPALDSQGISKRYLLPFSMTQFGSHVGFQTGIITAQPLFIQFIIYSLHYSVFRVECHWDIKD